MLLFARSVRWIACIHGMKMLLPIAQGRLHAGGIGFLRWTPLAEQFGDLVKLGSGCRQAATFSVSVAV